MTDPHPEEGDEEQPTVAMSTGQVKKITPLVIAGLFVLGLVRRRRGHRRG